MSVAWPVMAILSGAATLIAAAVLTTSCVTGDAGDAEPTPPFAASEEPSGTPEPSCAVSSADGEPVSTGSVAGDVLQLSRETFTCARHLVVSAGTDIHETAAAAQLAAALRGPLLLPHDRLAAELDRLDPGDVYVVGEAAVPAAADVHHVTPGEAATLAADALEVAEETHQPTATGGAVIASTVRAIYERDRVIAPPAATAAGQAPPPDVDLSAVIDELPADEQAIWLVEATDPMAILAVAPAAAAAGAVIVPVDGSDLFRFPQLGEILAAQSVEDLRRVGPIPEDAEWELRVLANGRELPGGGFELFPDDFVRRFVAYYGHPDTTGLGILGQHAGPEAALEHMRPLLDGFAGGSDVVVPTFNVIATVAHNGGATGRPDGLVELTSPRYIDYSTMHPPERFREWVDVAADADGYVVLDFQPGRNDFLYQVQHYEDLLRLPHVGIALDPEWRLGPGQTHLQQIGSVSAAEINTVIDWLADLVRDEGLPQKLLIVQQFRLDMIQDRDEILDRKEVAVVIQMDGEGQGGLGVKDETYRAITAGTDDAHWRWGWKNFVERDSPRPYTPQETMAKDPSPVYVSYQ